MTIVLAGGYRCMLLAYANNSAANEVVVGFVNQAQTGGFEIAPFVLDCRLY